MKRQRKSRAEIASNIKHRVKVLKGVDDKLYNNISSIIDEEMNLKKSSTIKDNNGNTLYYCYRTEQYYPIKYMVVFKNGSSRGYCRASQLALAEVNKRINRLKKELVTAITDANTELTENLKDELNRLEQAKKDNSIYRNLNYYINININNTTNKGNDNETK